MKSAKLLCSLDFICYTSGTFLLLSINTRWARDRSFHTGTSRQNDFLNVLEITISLLPR
jgi:hypothetical protein